ncbi:hypothetical protein GCM10011511_54270 [Puia dinghuensis]|uniref:histidine kinase n=2 Tax=Puia dinghuensis TaxID=1792502 RepID=A0A8J2UIQ7_9BACT|nr:hypothetical protein GCM10011511_54270 [Puia dinghuensis]
MPAGSAAGKHDQDATILKKLNTLFAGINIISREKTLDDICRLACEHIVKIFDFDYAVISLFDFQSRRIVSSLKRTYVDENKDLGECSPRKWVKDSEFPETADDILVKVMQKMRNVKVIGVHVFDDHCPEGDSGKITFASINKYIFDNYEHRRLARFYIPIIYRGGIKNGNKAVDLCLGVIEIGLKEHAAEEFSNPEKDIALDSLMQRMQPNYPNLLDLEQLLQLYTDSFAQPCYTAIVEEQSKHLLEQLTALKEKKDDSNSYSGLSYEAYATDVIREITAGLGADHGIIALKTFNHYHINYFDKGTYFSARAMREILNEPVFSNQGNIYTDKSILMYVCEKIFAPYYTDDVTHPDSKFVEGLKFQPPITSEMIVPIYDDREIVGVVDLYSEKPAFFNPIAVALTVKSMELFMSVYLSKKRQHVYNNLVKPAETWNHPRQMYQQLVGLLADYYYTEAIGLWERNIEDGKPNEYKLETDLGLKDNDAFVQKLAETLPTLGDGPLRRPAADIDLHYDLNKDTPIGQFCLQQGFTFYLSLSIRIHDKYEVFIYIFSKFDIFLEKPDKEKVKAGFLSREYEFLSQVYTKVAFSLQNLRITKALKDMATAVESKDQSAKPLQQIVHSAQIATGADIVVLFPCYPQRKEILKNEAIFSNDHQNKSNKKAVFADVIFHNKEEDELYNFDSDEECVDFLVRNKLGIDLAAFVANGFRTTHKIKSTSAALLKLGALRVGVMFFNYKQQQNLKKNTNLRQIILFFSAFAAYQIWVNGNLADIQKQNKDLDEKYRLKEGELERMIPMITRTSFYNIVEGSSHIIKNALFGIAEHIEFVKAFATHSKFDLELKEAAVRKAINLVMNVLTVFTFRDEVRKEFVDIQEIIVATTEFFQIRHAEISYWYDVAPDLELFKCIRSEFAMIIYNLVFNAITAIESREKGSDEGRIIIKASLSEDEKDYIITVWDNGTGIPHELDEKIYQAKFTTKTDGKGTGLGLYYIRKTLDDYNGRIVHESVVGDHTEFTVTIPLANNYIN